VQCHTNGLAQTSAIFVACGIQREGWKCLHAADLPQNTALYREDEVINACLEAVALLSLEILGGQSK
jgi:hypothetical protein